jgi:tetratricopeptide (TPR) repeat protein
MSEAHRGDTSHAQDAVPEADRDAKIEQLLLIGLDHYFAAQYDQAINVWTRVLFLDRSHPRARAYIERARSALAERQRESEELLQNGVAAFHRGEGDEARRLLRAAMDGGAPSEEALAVLDRLDRLETGPTSAGSNRPAPKGRSVAAGQVARRSRSIVGIAATLVLAAGIVAFGGYAARSSNRVGWGALSFLNDEPLPASAGPVVRERSLPLPRRGELMLNRAKTLASTGHLSDALTTLELIRATDPQKGEADLLRADLQRQLLALTTAPDAPPPELDLADRAGRAGRADRAGQADRRVP